MCQSYLFFCSFIEDNKSSGESLEIDLRSYDIKTLSEFLNTGRCRRELETFLKSTDCHNDAIAFSFTHLTNPSLEKISKYIHEEEVDDEISKKLSLKFPSLCGYSSVYINRLLAARQKFYDMFAKENGLYWPMTNGRFTKGAVARAKLRICVNLHPPLFNVEFRIRNSEWCWNWQIPFFLKVSASMRKHTKFNVKQTKVQIDTNA